MLRWHTVEHHPGHRTYWLPRLVCKETSLQVPGHRRFALTQWLRRNRRSSLEHLGRIVRSSQEVPMSGREPASFHGIQHPMCLSAAPVRWQTVPLVQHTCAMLVLQPGSTSALLRSCCLLTLYGRQAWSVRNEHLLLLQPQRLAQLSRPRQWRHEGSRVPHLRYVLQVHVEQPH